MQNGRDGGLAELVEMTATAVVLRLLRDGHLKSGRDHGGPIVPAVVHGDLWSGNWGRGRIARRELVEDVVVDPSSCYAHAEYDFGIMRMFGGFGDSFFDDYYEGRRKDEPAEEWGDRVELYEL